MADTFGLLRRKNRIYIVSKSFFIFSFHFLHWIFQTSHVAVLIVLTIILVRGAILDFP